MSECIATYNIQILVGDPLTDAEQYDYVTGAAHLADQRVLSNLPAMLEAVEEDLTNLLPPGYEARIREWSSDE